MSPEFAGCGQRVFAGVLTERANAEPQKYHVEYEKGVLKVKTPMSLSEELPRALAYEDNDIIVSAGNAMTPVRCVVRYMRARQQTMMTRLHKTRDTAVIHTPVGQQIFKNR